MTGNIIPFPHHGNEHDQRALDRLGAFQGGGAPDLEADPIAVQAASLCTPDDWAWSAVRYLKCALDSTQGGALGGTVEVSAAAVGVLLTCVERLATEAGTIGGAA